MEKPSANPEEWLPSARYALAAVARNSGLYVVAVASVPVLAAANAWLPLIAMPVTLDDVRLKLYVEDDEQKLHVGAAAFASLWQETPSQRVIGRMVALPLIAPVARLAYNAFAALLYRWNRLCGRW